MSATTTTRRKAQPRSKAKGTSQRQTEANQRNALKSSGPRTAEGKNRSRHNAVTHGLTAESTILPGEDASAFQARRQEIVDGMQPCNQVEAILLEQIARCEWKSMRAPIGRHRPGYRLSSAMSTTRRISTIRMG